MKSILLVEDDPFLIDIYTQKLKKAGFKIEVAPDGEKALRTLQDYNPPTTQKGKKHIWPDLLLLDIVLPRIEGWQILRKIKNNPKFTDLKIVILSNLGQKEEVERGLKLGARRYLIKAHYTPSEVVEEIKKMI